MATEQHQKFLERLKGSPEAVFLVAQWLHAGGKNIEIPALRFAPTASQADSYVDSGDIIVVERKRVEVKRLGVSFSGIEDWPFKEAFVSNKAAVDRSLSDVAAWVSVSSDMRAVAIIKPDTKDSWYLKDVRAKNTGNVEQFYCCPLDLVLFRGISP